MNWLDRARILLERLPIKHISSNLMVRFKFNPNQKRRFEAISKQWNETGMLRIMDLKSRRVGVSAQSDALLWSYCMGYTNINAKIVAHLQNSAEELFRVPADLSRAFPGVHAGDIQAKKLYFPHRGGQSQISLATAGTPAAGRGGTLSALHLSECAYYPQEGDSFVSMITSVSKGPGSIIILESTANGREGPGEPFFEYWQAAVAGKNGFLPIFLCWLDDPLCQRASEEADDAPQDDLEKELMGKPFYATRAQIAWMRRTKADDCRDIESKWLTDYPHHPSVAFQVSGDPTFPREELLYADSTIKEPLCRGKFVRTSGTNFRFVRASDGPWHLWKFPFDSRGKSDGFKYYGGADAALGTEEGDFAAICMLCGDTGELSARFSERVAPEELANQMDMAGRYYNHAMMNPELTGNLGRWALIKLRDQFRYPNIYVWKGRDDKKRYRSKSNALGFEMNQATRRLIIEATRSGLRMGIRGEPGALVVNDRALMEQLSLCTNKEWRWDVMRGHDDIAVAYFIACLTREQYPPARMTFAPRNIADEQVIAPPEQRVPVKLGPSELDILFYKEMKRIRMAAGLKENMRGTGRRPTLDRLYGI
jgi:hypothetical protein